MSANESESESDEGGQSDEDEPDFESRTKAAVPLQPVTKKICWNKEGKISWEVYMGEDQYGQRGSKN